MEWLGLLPLSRAPALSLPSEVEVLQMIWGHVNSNFTGFRGIASICCKLVGGKAICLNGDAGSCGGGQAACLLFKVKEPWVEPGIPALGH